MPTPTPTSTSTSTATPTSTSAAIPTSTPLLTARTYPAARELHPVVVAMPASAETTIESVARYIAEREGDPFLRVKALHDWAADRIAYNAPSLKLPRIPQADGDPQAVFQSRKGVCAGYARLLVEMGRATGDEIVYVRGDARSSRSPMAGEPHAWNAAKIEGRWYLIDATWDAGPVDDDAFKKAYSTNFLFTPPELFLVTHFPDKPDWQLIEQPIARAEFFRRPALGPAFFVHGLSLRAPDRSQVATDRFLDVVLDNPRGSFVLVSYEPQGSGAKTPCKGDPHGRNMRCEFTAAGTYDVHLYVSHEQFGMYPHAGSVQVNAKL